MVDAANADAVYRLTKAEQQNSPAPDPPSVLEQGCLFPAQRLSTEPVSRFYLEYIRGTVAEES